MSQNIYKPETTKLKIYAAASHLFEIRDFDQVTIRDICKEAGVSIGSFYHHFTRKDDVVSLFYDQMDNLAKKISSELDLADIPPYNKLVLFFVRQAEHIADGKINEARLLMRLQLMNLDMNIFSRSRLLYKVAMKYFNAAQEAGIITAEAPLEELCDLSQAALRGMWFDWGLHDDEYNMAQRMLFYMETILNRYIDPTYRLAVDITT